jgi:hypothetical protein
LTGMHSVAVLYISSQELYLHFGLVSLLKFNWSKGVAKEIGLCFIH